MEENIVCKAIGYTGKNVVVTGAAQGAGAGIAKRFAQAGANVAITYHRNQDAAAAKVAELTSMGVKAEAFCMDQREVDTIGGVMDSIVRSFGGIDVIVNNAGIYPHQNNLDMTCEEWDDMQSSNTISNFNATNIAFFKQFLIFHRFLAPFSLLLFSLISCYNISSRPYYQKVHPPLSQPKYH